MVLDVENTKLYVNLLHDGLKTAASAETDGACDKNLFTGNVECTEEKDVMLMKVNVKCIQYPHLYRRTLVERNSVLIDISVNGDIDGALSRVQFNPFWSTPSFERDMSKIPDNVQNLLIALKNGLYISVLPICNDGFKTVIVPSENKNTLRFSISKEYGGAAEAIGAFAIAACDKDPYNAVKKTYMYACNNGFVETRPREEKSLNEMYKGLGWCTWNAAYRDVSESIILEKLEEFYSKGICVKWIIIDDGWMQTDDEAMTLKSFEEDRKKFPNGLKGCIETVKTKYGVEKVGVWHAITGYWFGVDKNSGLYEIQKENLEETNSGMFIPKGERAYEFFSEWYSYLKNQGVDFVKIDGQGNAAEFYYGKKDCIKKCCELQKNMDLAVNNYFGANVINCMAMNNINMNNRPYSAISRNSDDFFPNKPETFYSHIMQNIYNAVFHGNLFFCDFDMWQTDDITAKQSSVLRAVSGGPIYLSDSLGKSNMQYIKPIADAHGNLTLCDDCARPLPKQLFCGPENGILKVYNRKGNDYVIAVFNLTEDKRTVVIDKDDCFDGEFAAYGYFAKKMFGKDEIKFTLAGNDVEIISLYHIDNGKIRVGELTKYISLCGENVLDVQSTQHY